MILIIEFEIKRAKLIHGKVARGGELLSKVYVSRTSQDFPNIYDSSNVNSMLKLDFSTIRKSKELSHVDLSGATGI